MWNMKWKSLLLDPHPILPMVAHLRYIIEPHCITSVSRDNSPWVYCVSPLLWAKASTPFILDYLYKGICIINILEDKDNISLWGRGWICFLSRQPLGQRLNRFASTSPDRTGYFPKLRFLSWDTHCADLPCMSHLPLHCPVALGDKGNQCEHAAHFVCCTMNNKVLCFWPSSFVSSASIYEAVRLHGG